MAEIFFPEKMEHTDGMNADEILKIHDDYIRYIVERIDFAFNGYTNKKKFFQAVEDVVEDGPLAKELENEKSAREQAIDQLNEKLQDAGGLFTTVDPETGIVYMHDKKEEPGLLPPYTESRNVIMISTAGIAVSNDGGVTYPMGFTLDDGVAILNKIYAIGIDADHITTGRITDAQGNYSLDLETGTVNMANANITGGNINIETSSAAIDKIALRLNSSAIDYEMLMSVNRIQSDAKFHRFDTDGNPLDGYGTEMRSSLGYGGASANVVFKDSDGNEDGNYTTTISGTMVSTLKSVNGNSHTISELGSDGSTAGNPQLVLNNPSNGNQTVKLNKDGLSFTNRTYPNGYQLGEYEGNPGQAGYVNVVRFTGIGQYGDMSIKLIIAQRRLKSIYEVDVLLSTGASPYNITLNCIRSKNIRDDNIYVYSGVSGNLCNIWVQKVEPWDVIDIVDCILPDYARNRISVSYPGVFAQSISNYVGAASNRTIIQCNPGTSYQGYEPNGSSKLDDFDAFVINTLANYYSRVVDSSMYIPLSLAQRCTSPLVDILMRGTGDANYNGNAYFDFTNNKIYLKGNTASPIFEVTGIVY